LGEPWADKNRSRGIPKRFHRFPKSVKFSGHDLPWALTLGGPRLPKAHSRHHRIHCPRLLPKAFYRKKPWAPWAAQGKVRKKPWAALGGTYLDEHFLIKNI